MSEMGMTWRAARPHRTEVSTCAVRSPCDRRTDLTQATDASRVFQRDLTMWMLIGIVLAFLLLVLLDIPTVAHVR